MNTRTNDTADLWKKVFIVFEFLCDIFKPNSFA